jgi:hypothetical protein
LPSGGLAARQGLDRHSGKQGKHNNTAEVPNAGEVSRVRVRGRVCVHGFVRVPVAKRGGEPKLSGTRHRNGKEKDSGSKQGSARVEEGSGTCKSTGSARWPAPKRRRVCAAARSGCGPTAALKARRAHQARSSHGSKAGPQLRSKEGWPHLGGHWPTCMRR